MFRPGSKLLLNSKGGKVRLTEKETSILRHRYRAGRRPMSRETLLQEVWGYNSEIATHTLETHIYRLRQKIEMDATVPVVQPRFQPAPIWQEPIGPPCDRRRSTCRRFLSH